MKNISKPKYNYYNAYLFLDTVLSKNMSLMLLQEKTTINLNQIHTNLYPVFFWSHIATCIQLYSMWHIFKSVVSCVRS